MRLPCDERDRQWLVALRRPFRSTGSSCREPAGFVAPESTLPVFRKLGASSSPSAKIWPAREITQAKQGLGPEVGISLVCGGKGLSSLFWHRPWNCQRAKVRAPMTPNSSDYFSFPTRPVKTATARILCNSAKTGRLPLKSALSSPVAGVGVTQRRRSLYREPHKHTRSPNPHTPPIRSCLAEIPQRTTKKGRQAVGRLFLGPYLSCPGPDAKPWRSRSRLIE
jgi:hypothetical protein